MGLAMKYKSLASTGFGEISVWESEWVIQILYKPHKNEIKKEEVN